MPATAVPATAAVTATEAVIATEAVATTEAVVTTEAVIATEAVATTEAVVTTEAVIEAPAPAVTEEAADSPAPAPAVTEEAAISPDLAVGSRSDMGRRGESGRAGSAGSGRDGKDGCRADHSGYSPHPARSCAHDDVPLPGVETGISGTRRDAHTRQILRAGLTRSDPPAGRTEHRRSSFQAGLADLTIEYKMGHTVRNAPFR
ncbi:hypothetical protein [Streptomyces sp. NPDC047453]|uniref:hypothetical protein n=1 Tax=Streptomyces sp. NPDC047453 TaxID=3154812 RepID=UPI0033E5396F